MSIDLTKIELGEGTLGITYGVASDGSGGTAIADAGACLGAELSYKKSYKDIEIGQVLAAVKSAVIGEEGTFKIKMLESQIENIAIALGGDPADVVTDAGVSETITMGNDKSTIYHKLIYTVPQVDTPAKDDVITVFRARVEDMAAIGFSKTDERVLEVTFKMFPESTSWTLFSFQHGL